MTTNKGKIYIPKLYHYFIEKPRKPKRVATIAYLEEKIAQILGEKIEKPEDETPEPEEKTPKPQDNFDPDIDYSLTDFNPWDDIDIALHRQEIPEPEEKIQEPEEKIQEPEEKIQEPEQKIQEPEEKIVEHQQDTFDPDIDYSAVDFNPWDHVETAFHDDTTLLHFDKPIQPKTPDKITQLITDVLTTSIKEKHGITSLILHIPSKLMLIIPKPAIVVDYVAVKNYGENILVQVLTVSKVSYGEILETIRSISPSCMVSGALDKEYELRQLFVQKFYDEKKPGPILERIMALDGNAD
ncbi:hypothetical protein K440DRAFT_641432 [Wilcoxina mikolae CBS 423.85]|nr:hypothetical protein K440DRAFT_641432 [Wilcoxina mikolae CBS 423.85]